MLGMGQPAAIDILTIVHLAPQVVLVCSCSYFKIICKETCRNVDFAKFAYYTLVHLEERVTNEGIQKTNPNCRSVSLCCVVACYIRRNCSCICRYILWVRYANSNEHYLPPILFCAVGISIN